MPNFKITSSKAQLSPRGGGSSSKSSPASQKQSDANSPVSAASVKAEELSAKMLAQGKPSGN
jgi:hypothetical protein